MSTDTSLALAGLLLGLAGGLAGRRALARGIHLYPGDPPSRPAAWVTPTAGLAAAGIAYRLGDTGAVIALIGAAAAAMGVTLAAADLDVHRLPRALTWPCYPALAVLLTAASAQTGTWHALPRAALSGLTLWALYYLLHLLGRRRHLGRGDVTLAGLIGTLLGWFTWTAPATATGLAVILAGGAAGALLLLRRVDRADPIAYGPAMIAAGLIVLALQ